MSHDFDTRHLNLPESEQYTPVRATTGSLDEALPWVIEFRVVGTVSTIQAQVHETMVIGRADPQTGSYPAVDLGPHGAYHSGVSRQHAIILVKENRIKIKDLGSINGTRLNGFQLTPGQEYRLRHGDELEIGQVKLQVRFAVVPTAEPQGDATGNTPTHAAIPVLGKGERVLIVEDDADVGKVFSIALRHAGFDVTVMENAASALGLITQQMPDVMVLDLMLPDMNGLDLVSYIRKQSATVPIIVCSGATGGYQMNQAKDAGANQFLSKPVSVEDLVKAVGSLLNLTPNLAAS